VSSLSCDVNIGFSIAIAASHSFVTFGRLYGLAMTLSGLLGLLLTPMDILTQKHLNGNYHPINITLIAVGAVTNIAVAVRLWLHSRKGRIVLEDEM
jgi:hypothetical protein